ncbi:hypothetical protein SAMN05192574_105236 [Mucilaginibacter gossypiicola]|uniref:Outer membrane protein beta-barrel domain-containing protein n=1 Tax=Mucilaginibacter gossypiicola TaxID=551995 RepID=A0A1H8LTP8_9SPHI|nr:hypothetical protein [Mucilaginibacter gossypiicola]SEO08238.1 hypothetical protein SAMN05192574_105236 [Mucilaginibacter gossypiicola]
MRKILILSAILLLLTLSSYGQAIVGKMYIIVPDFIPVYSVNDSNKAVTALTYRASAGTKFSVTGFDKDNNIKVTFWRYRTSWYNAPNKDSAKKDSSKTDSTKSVRVYQRDAIRQSNVYQPEKDKVYIGQWANYKEFAIKPDVFNRSCLAYYGPKTDFTWGVMTLPIKLRFGNGKERQFSFEEKLNLGFVAGVRKQIESTVPQSINYIGGFGISNVRTDSLSQKSNKSPAGTSAGAFSFNVGVLYAYDNFQIGAFIGADYIPGSLGRDWKYQGRPWVGLAIGISLFSRNDTRAEAGENK